jgi:ketosteroid isomerase-like protein
MSADTIRSAYEALGHGNPEPLVSLMSEDVEWRGRKRSWRFWEPVPSWRGPNEAREVITSGIEWHRRSGSRDYRLDAVEIGEHAAAATFSWTNRDGTRDSWSHALILRDGQIVHMQDFADPQSALKAIHRWRFRSGHRPSPSAGAEIGLGLCDPLRSTWGCGASVVLGLQCRLWGA